MEETHVRLTVLGIVAAAFFSSACIAQTWELGAVGGYGWYKNPSITNVSTAASAGFPSRAALGVVFGQNMYQYIGGEVRYLYRFGGPQLQSNGMTMSSPGYTNAITYNMLFHVTPRDSAVRPFVAVGSGIKVFTGTEPALNQSPDAAVLLRPLTQVEPDISFGGGLKYRLPGNLQVRLDFRVDMTPLPNDVIQPASPSTKIGGWVHDFMSLAGVSYVF
jgi:hypothetical protein